MTSSSDVLKSKSSKLSLVLIVGGAVVISLSLILFALIFFPVIREEYKFAKHVDVTLHVPSEGIVPVDSAFSVIIPKIGANSSVIANVDPYDPTVYQESLTRGVAHAQGTVFPGQPGNTFLFAHSSGNFYEANRYNSVFYLLNKLRLDDSFYLAYENEVFEYTVSAVSIVNPEDISYLHSGTANSTATLMTCWPAGTTYKRLIVQGNIVN